jgi:hypothetical protein
MVALCGWLIAFNKSETNGLLHRGYSLEGRTVLNSKARVIALSSNSAYLIIWWSWANYRLFGLFAK